MDLSDLPKPPVGFKSISPYLQRAKEMENVDPVISYWCAFHAAQSCMSIGHNEAESREFLMRLLDFLEHAKSKLSENDAVTNNLAATAYVENFALKVFDGADQEDQQGLSTRTTAQRFLASACFLEVLQSLTNQPEPDIIQKIKYAKWKAASISKALRDGTSIAQKSEEITQTPSGSCNTGAGILSDRLPSQPSSAKSTDAQLSDWPQGLETGKLPSPLPASNPAPSSPNKPSPFPSSVFPPAPLTNQQSVVPIPSAPSPPSFSNAPIPVDRSDSIDLSRFPKAPNQLHEPEPSHQTLYSTSVSLNKIQSTHQMNDIPSISATVPIVGPSEPSSASLKDPMKVSSAQKHAKWAISALNYDDITTAKNELQIALDILNSL